MSKVTPEALEKILKSRGWKISAEKPGGIVNVTENGLLKCVDGRMSQESAMDGPKALGGIYAIASLRGATSLYDLKAITKEVAERYKPCVHGDDHGPLGCGYFKLWKTGQLPGVRPPEYSGGEARKTVLKAGGVYEWLDGDHQETYTIINFRPKTTFKPVEAQRFVLDAWLADEDEYDLGMDDYLTLAAETVERLRPAAMIAKIVPIE